MQRFHHILDLASSRPADGGWALIEEYLHREQIVFSRNVNLFTVYVKISHQILVSLETCQQGSAFQFVNIHDLFVHSPANDTKIVDLLIPTRYRLHKFILLC